MTVREGRSLCVCVLFLAASVLGPGGARADEKDACAAGLFMDKSFGVSVTEDIQYGTGAINMTLPMLPQTKALLLDLYEPAGTVGAELKPGFVMVHGGAWTSGTRKNDLFENPSQSGDYNTNTATYAAEFAKRGYVCVSVEYRLTTDDPPGTGEFFGTPPSLAQLGFRAFEASLEDIEKAFQWMVDNAASLGVDTNRIAIGGYSAGAIDSHFVCYGPPQLPAAAIWSNSGALVCDAGIPSFHAENYIDGVGNEPPLIAFHGDADPLVAISDAREIDTRLTTQGVPHVLYEMSGEDHWYTMDRVLTDAPASGETVEELLACFMYEQLNLAELAGSAEVFFVDRNAPVSTNDGSSWEHAFLTIQDGLNACSSGDEVWVADGVYAEALVLSSGDVLYGGFEGYGGAEETERSQRDWEAHETTINASTADGGAPAQHAVTMSAVTGTRLDGFTVTGGHANGASTPSDSGAGIFLMGADDSNLITNCVIRNNEADFGGGGIGAAYSAAPVVNCTVTGNAAYDGAGIAWSYGTLTVTDCTVSGNVAGESAGGIAGYECDGATITNCTVSGNEAIEGGAGIGFYTTPVTIIDTEITNNTGTSDGPGGGVFLEGDSTEHTLEMTGCVVSGNSVASNGVIDNEGWGGAVYYTGGSEAVFTDCTFQTNSAQSGGGVFIDDTSVAVTMTRCTVARNSANETGGGAYLSVGSTTLVQCTIAENVADYRAGLELQTDSAEIVNCVITDNNATWLAGGLSVYSWSAHDITFENCTIGGNTAGMEGGGLVCYSPAIIRNTIFEGNTRCAITEYNESATTSAQYCLFYNNIDGAYLDYGGPSTVYADADVAALNANVPEASGNITGDPDFAGPGDYHLSTASAAVDRIVSTTVAVDRDGNVRPVDIPGLGADSTGTEYDIGAYELQLAPHLAASPSSMFFGTQRIGAGPTVATLTVTNSGTLPTVFSNVTITNISDSAFAFSVPPDTSDLAAGADRDFEIAFDPSIPAPAAGQLVIESNAPTVTVSLMGIGTNIQPIAGWSPGKALDFDGTQDYVALPANGDLALSGDVTVEAWVWLDATTANMRLFHTNPHLIGIQVDPTGDVAVFHAQAGGGDVSHVFDTNLAIDAWHHVAVVRDGAAKTYTVYLDGTPFGTTWTYTQDILMAASVTGDIGAREDHAGYFWDGRIDEVRVWGVARTQAEIRRNVYCELEGNEAGLAGYWRFNEGTGVTTADAAQGNACTLEGPPDWVTNGPRNISLAIDEAEEIVLTLGGLDLDADVLSARVTQLPANGYGTLYQYDGGVRGAQIVAVNTTVSDARMRVIYVPTQRDFPYTADAAWCVFDGFCNSNTATVHLDVTADDDGPPTATATLVTASPTGRDEIAFEVAFSESVAPTFDAADVTLAGSLSGTVVVTGVDPVYTVTVTLGDPDADGTIGIELLGGGVTDETGNLYVGGDASPLCEVVNFQGFTQQPEDARKYSGDAHTFSVGIDCPSCPVSYQWKWDDGAKMMHDVGPDAATYVIPDVTGLAGDYWCEVSYGGEVLMSDAATLEVAAHLAITTQPVGGSYHAGDTHVFSVVTSGGYAPFTYIWTKDDVEVSSDAEFTLTDLEETDTGWYAVKVVDDNGDNVQSISVQLDVAPEMPVHTGWGLCILLVTLGLMGGRSLHLLRGRVRSSS